MDGMSQAYTSVAHELRDRIVALIPEHPEILQMDSCWDLFAVDGFKCDDLQPVMAQAGWALRAAKRMRRRHVVEAVVLALKERQAKPTAKQNKVRVWAKQYGKSTVGKMSDAEIDEVCGMTLAEAYSAYLPEGGTNE